MTARAARLALAAALALGGCWRGDYRAHAIARTGGDPDRGRRAIVAYGCGSCHSIPGIRQADSWVGPPLDRFARRTYIAGRYPNTPDYLIRWIRNPHELEPQTAMQNTGVTAEHARDIAAYLYTLR